jgi:hypothetical protein
MTDEDEKRNDLAKLNKRILSEAVLDVDGQRTHHRRQYASSTRARRGVKTRSE